MRMTRILGGAAALAATGALGATALTDAAPTRPSTPAAKTAQVGLTRFADCGQLRRYASARSLGLLDRWGIGPYAVRWVGGRPMFRVSAPMSATGGAPEALPTAPAPAPTASTAPAADQGAGQAPDHSGTNVQEAGVDEPDIVLSDARNIFTTADGALKILGAGDTPRIVGTLKIAGLPPDAQLLRVGDRILVISPDWEPGVVTDAPMTERVAFAPGVARTVVRLVDVSDVTAPRLLETMKVDGTLVGARRPDGGAVRLVIRAAPDAIPMYGQGGPKDLTQAQATARNRAAIRRAPARTWLPAMTLKKAGAAKETRRVAVGCRDVARSAQFAGLNQLVVLTLDPAKGLTPIDRDAVMTDGEVVYGSARSLYVTTPRWLDPSITDAADVPSGGATRIHRFDISVAGSTAYASSGQVPGYVLNQFSMSEKDGVLRVASTTDPPWVGDERQASESYVTTLAERGRDLVTVGRLGGLGKTERIYGVRFIGNMGYVVTFRQMDPLHVIDLTDPANPRARGELKIPGYSAYLHPVGDGYILGVGQNATDEGRPLGTQVSLFDVRDPDNPVRVRNITLDEGWSEVESDHHAFLYWAPTGLAMVPVNTSTPTGFRSEAAGLLVSPDGITRVRTLSHPADGEMTPTIRRSMVIGDRVFTVSDRGVMAARLDNLSPLGYTPLG